MKAMTKISVILIICSVCGCVSKSNYELLKSENEKLKKELDECKFGADKLLTQAQTYYDKKEYEQCLNTISELGIKHPESAEYKLGLELKEKIELAKAENLRIEKERLAQATSKMRKEYDEMKGITWYYDKTSPQYVNSRSALYAYIGQEEVGEPILRLVITYTSEDWLFIEKYLIKVDERTYTISEDSYGEIKTDNGYGGVWEWIDRAVSDTEYEILNAIANGKAVKIRYEGSEYYKDRDITSSEKQALKNVLDAYKSLGGTND